MTERPRAPRSRRREPARACPTTSRRRFSSGGTCCCSSAVRAAAALTPLAAVLLPLVAARELTYLAGLVSIPRFRAAIDAKVHARDIRVRRGEPPAPAPRWCRCSPGCRPTRGRASSGCTRAASRCAALPPAFAAPPATRAPAEEIRTPGLDRLLWLFLRLLVSKAALDRFLQTMNEHEITTRLEELQKNLAAAQAGGDERVVRRSRTASRWRSCGSTTSGVRRRTPTS